MARRKTKTGNSAAKAPSVPQESPDATGAASDTSPASGRLRLEYRSPAELADNPRNWRKHPANQEAALSGVLSEVGWAGACLFNERTGRLIDGHLRRKVAQMQGAETVPVLIGSWSEADEAKILASLDPIAGLAEADPAALDQLLREVSTQCEALADMFSDVAAEAGLEYSESDPVELKQLDTLPPPKMSWALIGIPTVRFGEIAEIVEQIGTIDGVILETTANDG